MSNELENNMSEKSENLEDMRYFLVLTLNIRQS
jgi:hypothetical protein